MIINQEQDAKKFFSIQVLNFDKKSFTIKFYVVDKKLEIFVSNDCSLSLSYKLSFEIENFYKLNKFFRQFDSVEEIFDFIAGIEKLDENINIITEDKFLKLNISLPFISKGNAYNNIEIMIPGVEVKDNDLIVKLCEKVEKITVLELKFDYLFDCFGKNEQDFDVYVEMRFNVFKNIKNIDSKIITIKDFILPLIGVKKKLNKKIKEVKLLYRATRDGDSTQFHSKCDGKLNTLTFVKDKKERRFGGFASVAWHSKNAYITDVNSFLFSLDLYECYFYNTGNSVYGYSSYGPVWGGGHDLYLASGCLSNNSSATNQSGSYNYNGKTYCLSGGSNFQVIDYETYALILE
jgi:hypothetical protein